MNKVEQALKYHKQGYNCSQAVLCSFCEQTGLSEETAFKDAEGLAFRNSDTLRTCGAVTGMALVIGMINSNAHLEKPDSKASTYKILRELNKKFREKNGSTICHALKGLDGGEVLRSCDGCIEDAVVLINEYLEKNKE